MEETVGIIALYLIGAVIGFIILYFLISAAVKNGILLAHEEIKKDDKAEKLDPEEKA